jgi:hypothetical protein
MEKVNQEVSQKKSLIPHLNTAELGGIKSNGE